MKNTFLFTSIMFAAVALSLAGCASAPDSRQTGDQEASAAQAPQTPAPPTGAPTDVLTPQVPPSQQQAATLANPPNEDDPNDAGDPTMVSDVMTRDQWLSNLKDVLSTELCSQDEVFRSCYPVTEGECRQHIQAITASCANRYQVWIPEQLHQSERQNWDDQVGECTGGAMSSLLDAVYPVSNAQSCQQKLDTST